MSAQLLRALRPLLIPSLVLAAWALAVHRHLAPPELLPPIGAVGRAGAEQLDGGRLWAAVAASLTRTVLGFALAAAAGLALGLGMGMSRWTARIAGPTFHAYRQVAVFAWIPLISAWFGGGESTKVAFIAVAAVTPITFNALEGVRAVAREHVELARALEVGRLRLVTQVILPAAAPQLLTGLHLGLVTAWLATFGSEFFLQIAPGVGPILVEGRALGRMDLVLFGIAVIGLVGAGLNAVMFAIEHLALRWRPPRRAAGTA
ncbi:MAG: ABC transporter permease subunit [Anaeromyxobacter sp.]